MNREDKAYINRKVRVGVQQAVLRAIGAVRGLILPPENLPVVDGFVTSDATPTVMHTIELQDYEGGIVEIKCIGVTTTGVISAHLSASVLKQPAISLDYAGLISEKGFGPYGASADVEMVASAGYDIEVRVTGFAATDIVWTLWVYKNTRVAA